jgi:phenolic acid decarboxylase
MKLNVQCINISEIKHLSITGLAWFNGPFLKNQPNLAVCYENGKMQLMRNEHDDSE